MTITMESIFSIEIFLGKFFTGVFSQYLHLDLVWRLAYLTKMNIDWSVEDEIQFPVNSSRSRATYPLLHGCLLTFTEVFLLGLNFQKSNLIFPLKVCLSWTIVMSVPFEITLCSGCLELFANTFIRSFKK